MGEKQGNLVNRGLQFVGEARNELRKVSFPGKKETTAVTSVVVVSVFIIGFYLATIDWALSQVIKYIIR